MSRYRIAEIDTDDGPTYQVVDRHNEKDGQGGVMVTHATRALAQENLSAYEKADAETENP